MKTIKATSNYSNRTFTIRTYHDSKFTAKYRTNKQSTEEFNSNLNNTQNDWVQFLKTNDYYLVK